MPKRLRPLALAALALASLGVGPCASGPIVLGLPSAAGLLPVEVVLAVGTDPAAAVVTLDGADVTAFFAPGGRGLVGAVPVPGPGFHQLQVTRPLFPLAPLQVTSGLGFQSPEAAPALLEATPPAGASAVTRGAWLRFRLAAPASPEALAGFGFALECDGRQRARTVHPQPDGALILNPTPALPAGASCRVVWRDAGGGIAEHPFGVAADAPGGDAIAHDDRRDPLQLTPFPDDYFTHEDTSQPSGIATEVPVPPFDDAFQQEVFAALTTAPGNPDGWSRQTPIVLSFSHPLDPSAVPADGVAAKDPLAPIALVDVDPASAAYGERIAYRLLLRTDAAPDGTSDHVALLFPGIDLRERGRYALVVTRQAFAAGTPGRPVGPSPFFSELLVAPAGPEDPEVERARLSVEPTLATLAALPGLPIPPEDVALAVRLSIRTQPGPDDLTAIKELALASPPPALVLPDLAVNPCPNPNNFCVRTLATRALEVRGRVQLPDFRDAVTKQIARDPISGRPVQTGTNEVRFVLSLPRAALDGPVLPVMYQHGNPGSATEVVSGNNEVLDDAGFAVVGFTDTLNREFGQDVALQVQAIFFLLVNTQALPTSWFQTTADQIFFLRAIQGMGSLDLLRRDATGNPAVGPDGVPDLDPSTILYKGISEGANNAQRFLPFAPEILAAEATVGGARLGETLIHQSAAEILSQIGVFLPALRPVELWVGLSLFQAAFEPQDGHTYLRHLYREPLLPFAGSSDTTPPSSLWTEGVGDSLVPNNASRAMAAELGIPHVRPVAVPVPDLVEVDPPVAGNIAPGITSGYFQYLPSATPWCVQVGQLEGHYCPQSAPEAKAQRLHFLQTALQGTAEIVQPF